MDQRVASSTAVSGWGIGIAGAGAALIGGFMLAAWLSGAAARWSAGGAMVLKTNMALGLVLAGAALILLGICPQRRPYPWAGLAAAALILLLGSLTLSEHIVGWDLGIDQLLAPEPPGAVTASPNRMGPPGATSQTLLGMALLLLGTGRRRVVPYLGLAIILINLVPAVGYLYGISGFYGKAGVTDISWPTVVAMLGMGLGLVLACPESGPMALLLRRDAGGALLRRLLPAVVLLPLGLGFLRVLGQHRGLYDTAVGTGLLVLSLILIFSAMLWRNAVQLSRADRQQKQAEEALWERQSLLRSATDSASVGLVMLDRNRHYAFVNPQYMRILGLPGAPEDLIGREPAEVLATIYESQVAPRLARGYAGESVRYELTREGAAADGGTAHYSVVYDPQTDESGVSSIIVTLFDITERKRAEEALRESELFFRQMLESIPGMVFTTRPDGYCDYQSQQWVDFTGVPMSEHLGDGWNKLLHPEDRPRAFAAWRDAVEERAPYDVEYRVRRYDGEYEWFKVRGQAIRDAAGQIVRWFGVATSIEAMKRVEVALRESEERYRSLFSELLEGFCIIEVLFDADNRPIDYRFLEINPAFEGQTGLHDAQGKRMRELAPEHEAHWFEIYGKVALTGEPVRFVNEASALNRWYDVSAYRVGGPDSRKVAILFNDITEAKRAEQGLKRTAEELARSNQDLEQFAYVASHDLQEPLRMVNGYLQLIDRRYKDKLDTDAREFIDFAVDGATRMSRLITDLLDYSRIHTRGKPPEPVAMEGVLQRAVGNLEAAIRESDAQITHDPLPTVLGDASQLVQLLQNLVGNAIKFRSPDRPVRVYIGAEMRDDEWVFHVKDEGIGIEPQYAEKIFLIFQRLHGRGEYPGTGIGLSICKRIVERHGGRIWVQSQIGQGATFFFTLRSPGESR